MTLPVDTGSPSAKKTTVSVRDWVKVCALSLLTICTLSVLVELTARLLFPMSKATGVGEDCLILQEGTEGVRGVPNCVVWEKPAEGELADYRFNSSGYRNDRDFAPKPPGTFRIVILGTSMATGLRVPQEKIFSTLLPAELSQRTGRKVELYNLGLPWRSPNAIAHHLDEAIALKPDMILWVITTRDVSKTSWLAPMKETSTRNLHQDTWAHLKSALAPQALKTRISTDLSQMRTVMMLRNFLYSSPSLYIQSALLGADFDPNFLQAKPTEKWQTQLKQFDSSAAAIEEQSLKAGIPFAAVLIPDRIQVAMVSMMGDWPGGLDPNKLDHDLHSIITSHGGTYIEILPDFRTIPNPETEYMAVDGHPNSAGHAAIAKFLTNKLAGAVPPDPNAGPKPQAGSQPGQ